MADATVRSLREYKGAVKQLILVAEMKKDLPRRRFP